MPPEISLNWGAILVADLMYMVLGALWYGPLFGKRWIEEHNWSDEEMARMKAESRSMSKLLLTGLVAGILMMFILRHAIAYAGVTTAAGGVFVGFMNWLGFVAVTFLNSVLYERKSWTLYAIDTGYYLAAFLIAGAILAVWV